MGRSRQGLPEPTRASPPRCGPCQQAQLLCIRLWAARRDTVHVTAGLISPCHLCSFKWGSVPKAATTRGHGSPPLPAAEPAANAELLAFARNFPQSTEGLWRSSRFEPGNGWLHFLGNCNIVAASWSLPGDARGPGGHGSFPRPCRAARPHTGSRGPWAGVGGRASP